MKLISSKRRMLQAALVLVTSLLFTLSCFAQAVPAVPGIEWQRRIGGKSVDGSSVKIISTLNKGYLILSNSYSNDGDFQGLHHGSTKYADIVLMELDSLGNTKRKKNFGSSQNDTPLDFLQNPEGSIIISAYCDTADLDFAILKDTNCFFTLKIDSNWAINSMVKNVKMEDGGSTKIYKGLGNKYFTLGYNRNPYTYPVLDSIAELAGSLTNKGNLIRFTYNGNTATGVGSKGAYLDNFIMAKDSSYYLSLNSGISAFDIPNCSGNTIDTRLLKYDKNLKLLWNKCSNDSLDEKTIDINILDSSNLILTKNCNKQIAIITDTTYVLSYFYRSTQFEKMDSSGKSLKKLETDSSTNSSAFNYINNSTKIAGAIFSCGTALGSTAHQKSSDVYLHGMDTSLNPLWKKVIGGAKDDAAQSILAVSDGAFLIAGYTNSVDGDVVPPISTQAGQDIWIVKLNKNSCPIYVLPDTMRVCGSSVQLNAGSGYTNYQWNNGSLTPSIAVTKTGFYKVTTTNAAGCKASDSSFVSIINAKIIQNDTTVCPKSSIALSVDTTGFPMFPSNDKLAIKYRWSTNATTSAISVQPDSTRNYWVAITDGVGACADTTKLTLSINVATIKALDEVNICSNNGVVRLQANNASGYKWLNNDQAVVAGSAQIYGATTSGLYRAIMSNAIGCKDTSATIQVTIAPKPVANFSINSTLQCLNENAFIFTNSSKIDTGSLKYEWYFGDQTNAITANASRSYDIEGNYTILLKAIGNNGCLDTVSKTITTLKSPQKPMLIAEGATKFCQGGNVILSTNSTDSIQWCVDGIAINKATAPTFQAIASGAYTITCKGTNGCSTISDEIQITVNLAPNKPIITANGPLQLCEGSSLNLSTVTVQNAQWYFNGAPMEGSIYQVIKASQTGSYTVNTSLNNCTSVMSDATVVSFYPLPQVPIISASEATITCSGSGLSLSSSSNTNNQWYLNDVSINGAILDKFLPSLSGNYTVAILDANGCRATSQPMLITIKPTPLRPSITPGNTANLPIKICLGATFALTSSATQGNQWYLNGSPLIGDTQTSLDITQSGTYSIESSSNGCTSSRSTGVEVAISPELNKPIITADGPTILCEGSSVKLTSDLSTGSQWYLNNVLLAGANGQSFTPTQSGVYTVVPNNGFNCGSSTSAGQLVEFYTIPQQPVITYSANTSTICQGDSLKLFSNSSGGNQWFLNDTLINGATDATLTVYNPGRYTVMVTNIASCSSLPSEDIEVNVITTPVAPLISSNASTTFCQGSNVIMSANIGADIGIQWYLNGYALSDGNFNTYTGSTSGNYNVKATLANGCVSEISNTISLSVSPTPSGSIALPVSVNICDGEVMALTASGGNAYQWQRNGVNIDSATNATYWATKEGLYTVTLICSAGFSAPASNSIILNRIRKPLMDFTFKNNCLEVPVLFTSTANVLTSGAVSYLWDFGNGDVSTNQNPFGQSYPASGNYPVSLTITPNDCPLLLDKITKNVTIYSPLKGIRYPSINAIKNFNTPLLARNIGVNYYWSPTIGLNNSSIANPKFNYGNDVEYHIKITDTSGCVTVDSLTVAAVDHPESVYVAKAFVPNSLVGNNKLQPILIKISTINYFRVYNRFGQLMYQTKKMGDGWDGRVNGIEQPVETYSWIFEGIDFKGTTIRGSGKSTLIR